MMGIVVPETFWAYKKYNKIVSSIIWFIFFSYYHNDAGPTHIRFSLQHSLSEHHKLCIYCEHIHDLHPLYLEIRFTEIADLFF